MYPPSRKRNVFDNPPSSHQHHVKRSMSEWSSTPGVSPLETTSQHRRHHHHNYAIARGPKAPAHREVKPRRITEHVFTSAPALTNMGKHDALEKTIRSSRPSTSSPPTRLALSSLGTAMDDLLPFCTATLPLTKIQVSNLSKVARSLKEVLLLALQATVDTALMTELQSAVGERAAEGIVIFFGDEYEI